MKHTFDQYPSIRELTLYSESDTIQQVEMVTKQIEELRPLSKETENKIMQKLRLDWNYNSNAIEGNSLDYGETVAFLMHGVTAKGKPLKDYLDIKGHNEAINYLVDLIAHNEDISEKDIRAMHEIILVEPYQSTAQTLSGDQVYKTVELGKYKSMPNHVKTVTGEIHYYATPEETPILMGELINWYRGTQDLPHIHPIVVAAVFHHKFVSIHPFDDGNGRMGRLLMNMILMKYHYPPVIIKKENKDQYYLFLSQADSGNIKSFVDYLSENLLNTLRLYLRGARGESVEEPSDLDKKLLLFKKEIEASQDRVEMKKSDESKAEIIRGSIEPLMVSCVLTMSKFKDLFINSKEYLLTYEDKEKAGLKWIYNPIESNEFLFPKKTNPEYNDLMVFCFQFNDFKIKSKSFSKEVKVFVSFHDLDYRIGYTIRKSQQLVGFNTFAPYQLISEFSIQKFYHQNLSSEEIEKFTTMIGQETFGYIQDIYKNGDTIYDNFSKQKIEDEWEYFLDHNTTEKVRETFYELNSIEYENNIISIDVDVSTDMNIFNENVDEIEQGFYNYLKNESMLDGDILLQVV